MSNPFLIKIRRVGERRTWPFFRMRPEYEIVIESGDRHVYNGTTTEPSATLVRKGNVHSTDSYDWIRAADQAYAQDPAAWVADPFGTA